MKNTILRSRGPCQSWRHIYVVCRGELDGDFRVRGPLNPLTKISITIETREKSLLSANTYLWTNCFNQCSNRDEICIFVWSRNFANFRSDTYHVSILSHISKFYNKVKLFWTLNPVINIACNRFRMLLIIFSDLYIRYCQHWGWVDQRGIEKKVTTFLSFIYLIWNIWKPDRATGGSGFSRVDPWPDLFSSTCAVPSR